MKIDQGQKDVCPPGEAGQSGQNDHIFLAHGSPRAVSITLQPTSGGARFNRASNILQRGNIFMPAAEITAALTGIRSALDITKAMINLRDAEAFRSKSIELQGVVLETLEKAIAAREAQTEQSDRIRALEAEGTNLKNWDAEKGTRL
jgi:hypothetical protein